MPNTVLHTDKSASYNVVARELAAHFAVDHKAGEYVRGDVSTNKAENFFSQLKRSIDGTHHHVSVEHLSRALSGRVRLPVLDSPDQRHGAYGRTAGSDRWASPGLPAPHRPPRPFLGGVLSRTAKASSGSISMLTRSSMPRFWSSGQALLTSLSASDCISAAA